ncbi:MAG: GNAT family N-acetyltransferase [Rickettsiales bacterium]|nr:GNAT family N-acetyltransferase [Rickettsiales bacterium]
MPLERERRDEDKACRHFLTYDGDKPVATMRVISEEANAKIQRMAVLEECQGKGIGAKMLTFVTGELAKDENLERAILGSQEHAVAFYRRAGFNVISDAFEDAGITHYLMEKMLR